MKGSKKVEIENYEVKYASQFKNNPDRENVVCYC